VFEKLLSYRRLSSLKGKQLLGRGNKCWEGATNVGKGQQMLVRGNKCWEGATMLGRGNKIILKRGRRMGLSFFIACRPGLH